MKHVVGRDLQVVVALGGQIESLDAGQLTVGEIAAIEIDIGASNLDNVVEAGACIDGPDAGIGGPDRVVAGATAEGIVAVMVPITDRKETSEMMRSNSPS